MDKNYMKLNETLQKCVNLLSHQNQYNMQYQEEKIMIQLKGYTEEDLLRKIISEMKEMFKL